MCQKLVICKYIGFNPDDELCTVGRNYAYFIETKKKVEKGDFICIAEARKGNDDGNFCSVVRVLKVVNNYENNVEEGNALIAQCENSPRNKIFVGKAELGDYFAELDKKRKREEITHKLEKRFREAEKMSLYQKLAETDPEMKELLTELEALK
jgi:hypothetical protein